MPIYEYRCKNDHVFEVVQSMTDPPVKKCPECGAQVERVFHPVAVHFKGSGFYSTDYGRGGRSGVTADSKESSDSGGKEKEKAGTKSDSSSKSDSSKSSDSSSGGSGESSGSASSSSSKD
jgi:putative FmdB family regulatory protein